MAKTQTRRGPRILAMEKGQRNSFLALLPLSFGIFILLYFLLMHFGGGWNFLALSRSLLLVLRGGLVALTDMDQGFIEGLPNQELLRWAQEPVRWELVIVALGLFATYYLLKGFQFHLFATRSGSPGRLGDHVRAYLYGQGVNRVLPLNIGDTASAAALEGIGTPLSRAGTTVFLGRVFMIFEIAVFGIFVLFEVGWSTWLRILFWSLIILAGSYLFFRGRRRAAGERPFATFVNMWRPLSHEPWWLARAIVISLVAFLVHLAGAFTVAMAFTAGDVLLIVDVWVLMVALVAGQIAVLYPVTPGGAGQWEWGFAAALYIGGTGLPESVTIAILVNVFRYVVTGALFVPAAYTGEGVTTRVGRALEVFVGPDGSAPRRARTA